MQTKLYTIVFTPLFMFLISAGCKKESAPIVITYEMRNIGTSRATSGGKVTDEGSGSVTARGVCWSTGTNPTISDSKSTDGTGMGTFVSELSGLLPATIYYVRAYAINSSGTGYGNIISFKTGGNAPFVITLPPLFVSSDESALAASVNPYFVNTEVSFEYGETTGYGNSVSYSRNPVTYEHPVAVRISGLRPKTTCHFRVKAVNSLGTSYGEDLTFTTTQPLSDIDGNSYNTVTIGGQTWISRNLETTRFNDGTEIPLVNNDSIWAALQTPGFCWYNNDVLQSKDLYGALYNWYAVEKGNLCPSGYHVPTYEEWTALMIFLDESQFYFTAGSMGMTLATDTGWIYSSVRTSIANNDYPEYRNMVGFSILPAGVRDAVRRVFSSRGEYTAFWTSSEQIAQNAIIRDFSYDQVFSGQTFAKKAHGYSIRCLKN